jgi:hypothetical protein
MGQRELTGMYELLDAVEAAINSAAPRKRKSLARAVAAYCEDFPDEFFWATGPQAPTLLSHLMMAVTPDAVAQSKHIRDLVPMQQFLYNACHAGIWPTPVLGEAVWNQEPIRFFHEDLRNAFAIFCDESGVSPGKMNRNNMAFSIQEFTEVFNNANTRLRLKVPNGSTVSGAASSGRATAIEIPPLADCRARFDQMFSTRHDWNGQPPTPTLSSQFGTANQAAARSVGVTTKLPCSTSA